MTKPTNDPVRQAAGQERWVACVRTALNHELPNQLVAVQGLIRLLELEAQDQLSPEGREYLQRLAAAARRAHELVRTLAEIGQIDKREESREPVPLDEAAREAAMTLKKLFPEVVFEYHFPDPVPAPTLSRSALIQVLVQLLRNAAQSAQQGQRVRVQVGGRATSSGMELWVADDGRGLSAEERQRLFEPFTRGPSQTAGQGLGLFWVRQQVEQWGGSIEVQSRPGEGSVFTISILTPSAPDLGNSRTKD
jgi:signal transduction histidine kinase